ncbi:MAG: hypothetical protein M3N51_10755 [Actinomycetota bacterium]|nr:hypothetical protein [Actinomycetota bacterium]
MSAAAKTPERTTRWVSILWLATVASIVAGLLLWITYGLVGGVPAPLVNGVFIASSVDTVVVVAYALSTVALATVGAVLSARVPQNGIGWILLALGGWIGVTFVVGMVLNYSPSSAGGAPLADVANWLGNWTSVPFVTVPTTLVLALFPDGRLPSRRWRILPWLAVIGTAGWVAAAASGEYLGLEPRLILNPYAHPTANALGNLVSLLLVPALAGAVASLIVRVRTAPPDVRQQIKWVAYGGALEVTIILGLWALSAVRPAAFGGAAAAIGNLAGLLIPAAIGVAILKYRLYDIDRLLSRTVTYTVLALLLAATYSAGVIGVRTLVPASGDVAVAASTLAVAALFNPILRRVQRAVDRRFNRTRYDAQRVVEAFAARLRTITQMDVLISDLTQTLEQTLAPSSIGIWLKAESSPRIPPTASLERQIEAGRSGPSAASSLEPVH